MANILVIDDEAVLLELICNVLRLDGHEVAAVSSPLAALEYQVSGLMPLDLVLTDINMKPMSGFELILRLGKAGFTGEVLFTSGYPAMHSAIAASLGSRNLLEKPFTAEQLRVAVRGALGNGK